MRTQEGYGRGKNRVYLVAGVDRDQAVSRAMGRATPARMGICNSGVWLWLAKDGLNVHHPSGDLWVEQATGTLASEPCRRSLRTGTGRS